MNIMKNIRIEKLTLNIGAGKDQTKLKKSIKLIKNITGLNPVKTFSKKRIPEWGIRPGLPIGCKITIRNKKANELLAVILKAKDNKIKKSCFGNGTISFGIHEYIDVPSIKYDPEIGVMGFQVCVTLERPGFRIKKRAAVKKTIAPNHRIKTEESIQFMKEKFNVGVEEE